jgi:membrane-bound lytic murein transglycosylase A
MQPFDIDQIPATLEPADESVLDLDDDQFLPAFDAFKTTSLYLLESSPLRKARPFEQAQREIARRMRSACLSKPRDAKTFFLENFRPYRIRPRNDQSGFVTGYYQPILQASLTKTDACSFPILGKPKNETQRIKSRASIETTLGEYPSMIWVKDPIEAFMAQVQGSAIARFEDGVKRRLVYDGRNGRPYTSIGRILIETGEILAHAMSLNSLKDWVRNAGQGVGQRGREFLWRNESFVFFRMEANALDDQGPIGGAGLPLRPMVSMATDRAIWPYGTPFVIRGDLGSVQANWTGFRRLMISQDTGTAIVGPARGDIFVGTGEDAGDLAALIRHNVEMIVLLPRR